MGGRVLIQITPRMRILVAIESIDARKALIPCSALSRETGCRSFFRLPVYLPQRERKSIRILAYDWQGFWLATKRLSLTIFNAPSQFLLTSDPR